MIHITRCRLFFSLLTRAQQAICDAHFAHALITNDQSHQDPVSFLSTVLPDVKSSAADDTSDVAALYPPLPPPPPSTLALTHAGSHMYAICDVPLVPQIDYHATSTSTTHAAELEGALHCIS